MHEFYWKYHCLHDLPQHDWKRVKFDKNGIPYSYMHRLEPSCPTLIEDGGYIEDLETFKQLYEEREEKALEAAHFFLVWADKIKELVPEDGLDLMRKSILTCAKVSKNPIYRQLIEKYNWNE